MLRLVYLHQYFKTPEQGGGTRSYEFSKRLAKQGFDVHVVTSDTSKGAARGWVSTRVAGFTVHAVGVPYSNSMNVRQRLIAFFRFAAHASLLARALRGDVVFATSTPLTIGIPGIAATVFRRCPLVVEVRDLWPELPIAVGALRNPIAVWLARWLERYVYRHAAHVVALSPGMRDGVVATGYDPGRVTAIPNACDLDEFVVSEAETRAWLEVHPDLKNRPFALYAGTLGKMNNVSYLVEVAATASRIDPRVAFLVVGDGAERDLVANRARLAGVLERNFFMLGHVSKREVACALNACSVALSLFLPLRAMEANSANKAFDALAAGRPLAINYGGWQAEFLRVNGAGISLPPGDPAGAAREILSLVADPARRESMAAAARRVAETEFSRDLLAERLTDVLRSALEQDARGCDGWAAPWSRRIHRLVPPRRPKVSARACECSGD